MTRVVRFPVPVFGGCAPDDFCEVFELLPALAEVAASRLDCGEHEFEAYFKPPAPWTDDDGSVHLAPGMFYFWHTTTSPQRLRG